MRKNQEHTDANGVPVWKLKSYAYTARKALRAGLQLKRKVDSGMKKIHELDRHQTKVLDDMSARLLHVEVDKANKNTGMALRGQMTTGLRRERTCVLMCPWRSEHICEL